jgi:GNAT superfamily N-acetyltransferase
MPHPDRRRIHPLRLPGGQRATVRPVGPSDADIMQAYVRGLSPAARYNRFLGPLSELPAGELDRITHLDGRRHMALVAETTTDGGCLAIGEARYAMAPDTSECECAVSVAEAWRGQGLGALLLTDIERRARRLGARTLVADVLRTNEPMQRLARKLGFRIAARADDPRLVRMVKVLSRPGILVQPGERAAPGPLLAA